MPAGLGDVGDAGRCAVATVPQQQIPGSHRDTPEGLAAVGVGDLEEVALQILPVDAVVDPPVGAEAAGPADGGGIGGADAVAVGQRRGGVTLPQLVSHSFFGARALERSSAARAPWPVRRNSSSVSGGDDAIPNSSFYPLPCKRRQSVTAITPYRATIVRKPAGHMRLARLGGRVNEHVGIQEDSRPCRDVVEPHSSAAP